MASLLSPVRSGSLLTSVARRLSALRRARRRSRPLPPAPEWRGLEALEPRLLLSADLLDATFGDGGVVLADFEESAHDSLAEVLVQEDGKIVAMGTTTDPFGSMLRNARITLTRYLPDGTVDESFGENGLMASTFTGDVLQATVAGAMVEEDGSILTVGTLSGTVLMMRHDASGFPDADFGRGGIQLATAISGPALAESMALDADGNIIVAGSVTLNNDWFDFLVARFTPDGELDPTFGEDGWVTTSFGEGVNDFGSSVVVDEQGRIIVAGSSDGEVVLARFDSAGDLDEDFGTMRDFPGAEDASAASIALDGDGGVILTGTIDSDFLLARYDGDGVLDTAFGDRAGWVRTDFHGGADEAERVRIDAEGRILLVGTAQDGPESEAGTSFAAARYHANGDLDSGFGDGGKLVRDVSDSDRGSTVALDSEGRILFGGSARNADNQSQDFAVMRYAGDGDADPSFGDPDEALGETGLVLTDFPSRGNDRAQAVITQEDGGVLVAGLTPFGAFGGLDPVVVRYRADGRLDTSFGGGNGWAAATQNAVAVNASMAVDGEGRILLAFREFGSPSFEVARFTPDGVLDPEFAEGGIASAMVGSGSSFGGVAADAGGGVAVTGQQADEVVTVRFTEGGDLDGSFGDDGIVRTNLSERNDRGTAVAIDDQGRTIVAAQAFGEGTSQDFAVLRYTADGTLDESFGGGAGYVLTDFHGWEDRVGDLVIDAKGRILLAGTARNPDGPGSLALVRFDEAGELDGGFGEGGLVRTPTDWAFGQITLDQQGRIVLAGTAADSWGGHPGTLPRGSLTFALVRYHSDGTVDTTLDGDDGFVTTDLGTRSFSVANAVAVDSQGRIVVVGSARTAVTGDDFAVVRYAPLSVDVGLESQWIARGDDQPLTGIVTRSGDFSEPLELALTSSDPGELEVPESVVIEAGAGSAAFEVWAVGEVGAGAQTVTITASVTVDEQEHVATAEVDVVDLPNLSGVVFDDLDSDGARAVGEEGLGGATVRLSGQSDRGNMELDAVTLSDGSYIFEGLRPGTYSVIVIPPEGFLDGTANAGDLGGVVGFDTIGDIMVEHDDPDAAGYDFGLIRPSSVAGFVWEDFNADGEQNFGEGALGGADLVLRGTDYRGEAVEEGVATDGGGGYVFDGLRAGDYAITAEEDADVLGEAAPLAVGLPDTHVTGHDFGARPVEVGGVVDGQTATVEFWEGKDGRRLVESLNDGRNDTRLSGWLAATFPNLYGADAGGNDLRGMTNREVHRFLRDLAQAADDGGGGEDDGGDGGNGKGGGKSGGPPGQNKKKDSTDDAITADETGGTARLDAEVLALALSVYVTHEGLAGGDVAADYGFHVTRLGVGVHTWNVGGGGGGGSAFDTDDDDELNIMDILLATDALADGGVLYGGSEDLRGAALEVYSGINARGGIG